MIFLFQFNLENMGDLKMWIGGIKDKSTKVKHAAFRNNLRSIWYSMIARDRESQLAFESVQSKWLAYAEKKGFFETFWYLIHMVIFIYS